MKLITLLSLLFSATSTWAAVDEYTFSCQIENTLVSSMPGMKQAPDNPVVGLNIKVLKSEVPLYLIKASFTTAGVAVEKDLFVTDWVKTDMLSAKGNDLLSLLSLFYGVDTANIKVLRAAIPSNILEDFAYLEIKDNSNVVKKLGFKGIDPTDCK